MPEQYGHAVYAGREIPSCRKCAKALRAGWFPLAQDGICEGCECVLEKNGPRR